MIRSFLIKCSGANPDILEKCPKHESTIQAGIGGIVLGTAALAFLSGGFALYTVFKNPWAAVVFGSVWSLIIFTIDRFIISTVKKTGNFWNEFQACLPRLVFGVVIGVTISEPLKLELFRSEIEEELDAKLKTKQALVLTGFDRQVSLLNGARTANAADREKSRELADKSFNEKRASLVTEIRRLEEQKAEKDHRKQLLYDLHLGECAGRAGTGIRGEGPECIRTRRAYETAREEWRQTAEANDAKIAELKTAMAAVDRARLAERTGIDQEWQGKERRLDEREEEIAQRRKESLDQLERIASDGFLARYHALGEIANRHPDLLTMSWMISVLFILVEIAPVMSKMIRPDGPYDHILNRIDEEVQLEQEAASQVNKTFFGKEFVEHQWARKVNEMEYAAVRSILEKSDLFGPHHPRKDSI